jgi:tripartite-type tricarboxylate transporter receptor subunit TctC
MRLVTKMQRLVACAFMAAMISRVYASGGGAGGEFPQQAGAHRDSFAAGGFADITMRVLADKLGERLNQRVIIANRPGGRSWLRG